MHLEFVTATTAFVISNKQQKHVSKPTHPSKRIHMHMCVSTLLVTAEYGTCLQECGEHNPNRAIVPANRRIRHDPNYPHYIRQATKGQGRVIGKLRGRSLYMRVSLLLRLISTKVNGHCTVDANCQSSLSGQTTVAQHGPRQIGQRMNHSICRACRSASCRREAPAAC
jgi:hypothetical protein